MENKIGRYFVYCPLCNRVYGYSELDKMKEAVKCEHICDNITSARYIKWVCDGKPVLTILKGENK